MPYKDRNKQKKYLEQHYRDNKYKYNDSQTRRRNIRRDYVNSYKMKLGCSICGYKRCAAALEFHHLEDDKETTISILVRDRASMKRLDDEMNKCSVLCANCHREQHNSV